VEIFDGSSRLGSYGAPPRFFSENLIFFTKSLIVRPVVIRSGPYIDC
jgi:hypothetical protein